MKNYPELIHCSYFKARTSGEKGQYLKCLIRGARPYFLKVVLACGTAFARAFLLVLFLGFPGVFSCRLPTMTPDPIPRAVPATCRSFPVC